MKKTLVLCLTVCLFLVVPALVTAGGAGGSHGKGWSGKGGGAAGHQAQHRSAHHHYAAPAASWHRGGTYPPHQHQRRSYSDKRKQERHVPARYRPSVYRSGIILAEPRIVVRISL